MCEIKVKAKKPLEETGWKTMVTIPMKAGGNMKRDWHWHSFKDGMSTPADRWLAWNVRNGRYRGHLGFRPGSLGGWKEHACQIQPTLPPCLLHETILDFQKYWPAFILLLCYDCLHQFSFLSSVTSLFFSAFNPMCNMCNHFHWVHQSLYLDWTHQIYSLNVSISWI